MNTSWSLESCFSLLLHDSKNNLKNHDLFFNKAAFRVRELTESSKGDLKRFLKNFIEKLKIVQSLTTVSLMEVLTGKISTRWPATVELMTVPVPDPSDWALEHRP